MADYTELVKALRSFATVGDDEKCDACPWQEEFPPCVICVNRMTMQAADAIEELQQTVNHYKGCSDDWYREACDYKAMVPRWISVEERLPEINEEVLVVAVNDFDADEKWVSINWLDKDNQWPYAIVTHWMPLPAPPKEET